MNKFAWLFCGCILALSACSERQLGPDSGTADGPEIRFGVSEQGSGTKALIEANGLAVAGTQLHVFDILTGFNGTVNGQSPDAQTGELTYIDKTIGYVGSAWPFVVEKTENNQTVVEADTPAYYRWTKTGTHTFFGYLTKDPAGNTFTGATMNGKVLSISERALTPATTPQFDFLYSDIISHNATTRPYPAIQLSMKHLFTALAINIVNESGAPIENLEVSFTNVHSTNSATIDWSGLQAGDPDVEYGLELDEQDATNVDETDMFLGTLTDVPVAKTVPLFSGNDGAYRLLWPQKILAPTAASGTTTAFAGSQIKLSLTYSDDVAITHTANLSDLMDANDDPLNLSAMEAGKKYLLTIKITFADILFRVEVQELVNINAQTDSDESFYIDS